MLGAAKFDFSVWAAATFRKQITVLSADVGSTPQDLTGYIGTMTILSAPDGNVLYTLSTTNSGMTLGGTAGTISLYIPASVTSGFEWGSGIYTLYITASGGSGDTTALLWGKFSVTDVI